jgi:hypothetical protein
MRKWLIILLVVALVGGATWWFVFRKKPAAPTAVKTGPTGTGQAIVANPIDGQAGNEPHEEINPEGLPDAVGTDSGNSPAQRPEPIGYTRGTFITPAAGVDFLGNAFVTAPFQYNNSFDFI